MADDLSGLFGTIVLGGIALRAFDSRPYHSTPRRTVTRTRTVYVNRSSQKPTRVVTKRVTTSSRTGPGYPFRLNYGFFRF